MVALIFTIISTAIVIKCANKYGFVVYPSEGRWHTKPTALLGGIAICFGFLIPVLTVYRDWQISYLLFVLCSLFMFIVGLIDDLKPLKPKMKLVLQVVISSITVFAGFQLETGYGYFIDLIISIIWIVGITNAVNLIDNMDGFSTGISLIASLVIFSIALTFGHAFIMITSLALIGATSGFLVFNFNPAKIFMGDCGSLLLGYVLATLTLHIQSALDIKSTFIDAFYIPVFILAVPIFDTFLVMVDRKLHGKPIFQGGKDHSSHRLVYLLGSEKKAVLILYGLGIFFGTAAYLGFLNPGLFQYIMITIAVALGLILGYILIHYAPVHKKVKRREMNKESINF